jgi:putative SOS response-associated peptidase YedK
MAVILPWERHEAWLDPEFGDTERLAAMLGPYPVGEVKAYPVSTLVNNARVEDERCVEPFDGEFLQPCLLK